jgi:hypothetical protein
MLLEYASYLWVGWPLQYQIIDGPASQGVLIWNDVCQVGKWDMYACNHLYKSDTCAFDTGACNVEGCGLIADVPNLLVK